MLLKSVFSTVCLLCLGSNSFVFRQAGRPHTKYAGELFAARKPKPTEPDAAASEEEEGGVAKKKGTANKTSNMDSMEPAKRAALQGVLNQIERNYGRGSLVRLGDASHMLVDSTPSGSLTLVR